MWLLSTVLKRYNDQMSDYEKDNFFYREARKALDKVNGGNEEDVPPYMSTDEWKTHNALIIDQIDNPEQIFCTACKEYHIVSLHD